MKRERGTRSAERSCRSAFFAPRFEQVAKPGLSRPLSRGQLWIKPRSPMGVRRTPRGAQSVPVSQLQKIDQLCDHFEQGWQNGLEPRIEDYLKGAAHGQQELLHALVALELEL